MSLPSPAVWTLYGKTFSALWIFHWTPNWQSQNWNLGKLEVCEYRGVEARKWTVANIIPSDVIPSWCWKQIKWARALLLVGHHTTLGLWIRGLWIYQRQSFIDLFILAQPDRKWLDWLCSNTLGNRRQVGSVFRWKYLCFLCARFLDTEYRYFLGTGIQTDLGEESYSMNSTYAPKVLTRPLKNMPVNKTLMQAS